jgi:integrase/recombinase XerD
MGLQEHLKQRGLSPGTRTTYGRIAAKIEGDPVQWLLRQSAQRKGGLPVGTLLPMRAAVKHYLMAEQGLSEAETDSLMPKIKGKKAHVRTALLPEQLALFLAAVDKDVPEPSKTILKLLPLLGLRIGEIVGLRADNFESKGQHLFLYVVGKGGKKRVIPVPKSARVLLQPRLKDTQGWLFPGRSTHISAAAVRHHTRRLRQTYPDLGKVLCPHQLRHTFATLAVARGMSLPHLQALLGHASIKTTERYLHPSEADLAAAMEKVTK